MNGFGLNLSFSYNGEQYGVNTSVSRQQIGAAFSAFVKKEAEALAAATAFAELLYEGSIGGGAPSPPAVDTQYFAIADPNDMLQAKLILNTVDAEPLASYWDATLADFFKPGNYLSINLSADATSPNIYSGRSTSQTNPLTGRESPAFTLTNATTKQSYMFYQPPAGYQGALYVFKQAFDELTPAGSSGDAGLLQDNIWEALCRGVALLGIFTTPVTNGQSTTAWNDSSTWYQAGSVCHFYAKFLHYATIDGTDSRQPQNGSPIFSNNAAYGFSMDEDPLGPYSGPHVPSKTSVNVPGGSTIQLVIGPWRE